MGVKLMNHVTHVFKSIQMSAEKNFKLQDLIDTLEMVQTPGEEAPLDTPIPLNFFLPKATDEFYRHSNYVQYVQTYHLTVSRDVLQVQRLPAPASLHGERGVDCLSRASPGQPEAAQPVPEGHLLGREGRREEAGTQQEEDQGVCMFNIQ